MPEDRGRQSFFFASAIKHLSFFFFRKLVDVGNLVKYVNVGRIVAIIFYITQERGRKAERFRMPAKRHLSVRLTVLSNIRRI